MQAATILIIDDEPANLEVIAASLQEQQCEIMTARSGEDGIHKARQGHPDLIVLDVMLPQMDGFETCRRLKVDDATKEIPVIFLIGLDSLSNKVQGFAAGGVDYLIKPIQPEEVVARVTAHLTLQRLQQQAKESEVRYRAILDSSLHAFWLIDDRAQIQAFNSVARNDAQQMLGVAIQPDEPVATILPAYGLDPATSVLQRVLAGEAVMLETCGTDVTQASHDFILYLNPVQADDGLITGVCLNASDVTAKKVAERENLTLKAALKERWKFEDIIGKSPAMQQVYELIAKAAARKVNVLISGETGVGKELVARTIHQLSVRRNKPMTVVNCGAITETLFEREFFGHRKGAFTGADRDREGFFASAHHGTLFLDEIGELSPVMQVKLLRAIETGEYTPIGDTRARTADVRIIAATNRNPDEMCRQGIMREDFYYRICILLIAVPPLRERRDDIPLLIDHFLSRYSQHSPHEGLPKMLFNDFCAYDWPGNVRQLQTKIQRYLAIGEATLPPTAVTAAPPPKLLPDIPLGMGLLAALDQVEKQMILNALRQSSGRKEKAAALLGINRRTLYKKMKQHGIE